MVLIFSPRIEYFNVHSKTLTLQVTRDGKHKLRAKMWQTVEFQVGKEWENEYGMQEIAACW